MQLFMVDSSVIDPREFICVVQKRFRQLLDIYSTKNVPITLLEHAWQFVF